MLDALTRGPHWQKEQFGSPLNLLILHTLREVFMREFSRATLVILVLSAMALVGCQELVRDTQSLFLPRFHRSEIFGFFAGLGTTFAAVPDLVAMLRRRSSVGMNPRMAAIMGAFQILWIYYGLLIVSRPVVAWNVIAVLINFLSVGAYFHFARKEKTQQERKPSAQGRSAGGI